MNIFKLPKLDQETSKRLGDRVLMVFIIALICFTASLAVRLFVLNRIDDARTAFKGIDTQLPALLVEPSSVLNTEDMNMDINGLDSSHTVAKTSVVNPVIDIEITDTNSKILGKQKFISFDYTVNSSEVVTIPNGMTAGYIKIPVFSKSDVKNFKAEITIDGKNMIAVSEFNKLDAGSYGNKNSFYSIKIPNEFQGKDATLHYSWDSQGSRSINLGQGVYTLNLDSEFDNIRIKGSDYGSLEENSKNTKAVFNIDSSYETDQSSSFRATDIKYAGIDFLSGADDITMVDRITKYASLVIVLTFFMIFLLDMRRRFIANKIQYILVGVSLCLFYLLNLSLGEEIGFMGAYIIATIVTMVINGAYIGTALNSKKYGIATATGLLVIYAVIYWLIQVQSINLLAGTVLLYIVLMIMMFYTAKMNQNKSNNI